MYIASLKQFKIQWVKVLFDEAQLIISRKLSFLQNIQKNFNTKYKSLKIAETSHENTAAQN